MYRLKLLLAMMALCALMAAVVIVGSPYAPVVGPVMEIEDVWAIEDAREESASPLVTALENHGAPLGYDAQSNTFYCTLGLENGEDWPELHLTAPGARGVSVVFVDDYSYDWCADALSEGYEYQIMAYTDTQYAYAYIVFTGLPIVSLKTEREISLLDTPGEVSFAQAGGGARGRALVHQRGAGSAAVSDKKSYKIDFVHGAKDSGALMDVPALGMVDDVILLAGVMDDSLMREKLSWDLYSMIAREGESYGGRRTQYIELFVNDAYSGAYIMMDPVDDAQELSREDTNAPARDSVYRSAQIDYAGERLYVENPMREGSIYELYHAPAAGHEFDALRAYLDIEQTPEGEEHDAAFEALALRYIDFESILRYYLFVQAGGMSDNVFNNMYVIAHRGENGVRYRFAPWDMDLTWGRFKDAETGEAYNGLFSFPVAQRIIDMDAGGKSRALLKRLWTQMRETAMNEGTVQALLDDYTHQLSASGAYVRNALLWRGDAYQADGYEILSFAQMRFETLDAIFEADAL